jgi:hypothetical protein
MSVIDNQKRQNDKDMNITILDIFIGKLTSNPATKTDESSIHWKWLNSQIFQSRIHSAHKRRECRPDGAFNHHKPIASLVFRGGFDPSHRVCSPCRHDFTLYGCQEFVLFLRRHDGFVSGFQQLCDSKVLVQEGSSSRLSGMRSKYEFHSLVEQRFSDLSRFESLGKQQIKSILACLFKV